MRNRSFAWITLAVLVLSGAAAGACGGGGAENQGASNPSTSSTTADTSAATTPPTDTGAATASASAPPAASTPPPAPTLPPSYTAAADALNTAVQALGDDVKANIKDCKKIAAAFDKFTNDKNNATMMQTYLAERQKLTLDQIALSDQKYPPDAFDKQMASVGPDAKKCQKDPKVKKALQGFLKMFMGSIQASGAGGAPPAASGSAAPSKP